MAVSTPETASCLLYTSKGMPFRDAYKLTGCMVSDCIAADKTLEEPVSYTHLEGLQLCVLAVQCTGVLGQVVGADGEEVALGGQLVRDEHGGGGLDHGAYFNVLPHLHALGGQLGAALFQNSLGVLQLPQMCIRDSIHTGLYSSLRIKGKLVLTPQAKQPFELNAESVEILGDCPADEYPLQKKKMSMEYLRTMPTLRPRTNTFNAAFRVRSVAAYAIHKFFQENGFVYAHSPLITASDCEGAGEMFRVTTLDLDLSLIHILSSRRTPPAARSAVWQSVLTRTLDRAV